MAEFSAYVGLDVHKDAIAVAVALPGREEAVYRGEINNQLQGHHVVTAGVRPSGFGCCREDSRCTTHASRVGLSGAFPLLTPRGQQCPVVVDSRPEMWCGLGRPFLTSVSGSTPTVGGRRPTPGVDVSQVTDRTARSYAVDLLGVAPTRRGAGIRRAGDRSHAAERIGQTPGGLRGWGTSGVVEDV